MMSLRDKVTADLESEIDASIVEDLISTYEALVAKHRAGDLEGALTKAGRFVEHSLRAIEYVRSGTAPVEIKSVATTIRELENDTSLPESLRLLVPRALYGMAYNIRSKRNAVHVKEIDPRYIDVAMAVSAASWTIAELVRLYHVSDEASVERCMLALSRTSIPFIEAIDGETVVGRRVDPRTEMLLLLAHASPNGLSRTDLGKAAKCSPSSVTRALKNLIGDRFVHQAASKKYFLMTEGEAELAKQLAVKSR